jgi:hypothetical protein
MEPNTNFAHKDSNLRNIKIDPPPPRIDRTRDEFQRRSATSTNTYSEAVGMLVTYIDSATAKDIQLRYAHCLRGKKKKRPGYKSETLW